MTLSEDSRLALRATLVCRILYSLIAAALGSILDPSPNLLRLNAYADQAMPKSAGWPFYVWGVWERFDTMWYIHIAQYGFDRPETAVNYPLYPALMWMISLTGIPLGLAAVIISTVAAYFCFFGLARFTRLELGADLIPRVLFFASFWPAAFMLFAGYPESLLLALVIWSWIAARTQRWWLAGILGFFAVMTKAIGLAVLVPLLFAAWNAWPKAQVRRLLPIGLPVVAAGLITWFRAASGYSIIDVYRKYLSTEIVAPWVTVSAAFEAAFKPDLVVAFNLSVCVFVAVFAFVGSVSLVARLYAAACLYMVLSKHAEPLHDTSIRYLLPLFPAWVNLASLSRRFSRFVDPLYALFSLAVNFILMTAFIGWSMIL